MKSLVLKSSIVGLTLFGATFVSASDTHFPAYFEKKLVHVCEAIQDNKVNRFKRHVKRTGIKLRDLQEGLRCNGMDITSFAVANSADKTALYIAKKTGQNEKQILAMIEQNSASAASKSE
ncbi:MAG: DUF3718 domain-containing protein [Pseudomonadota bacterium]